MFSYIVWNYDEGYDSYYSSVLVDLTQPVGEVRYLSQSYDFSTSMGARRQGQEGTKHFPLENVKTRFTSTTTF